MCPEKDRDYCYAQGKVIDTNTVLYEPDETGRKLAVNIDIFVYDNAPNDEIKTKKCLINAIFIGDLMSHIHSDVT